MKKIFPIGLAAAGVLALAAWLSIFVVPAGHFAVAGAKERGPGWHLKPFWIPARIYADSVTLAETLHLQTREGARRDVKVSLAFRWDRAALIQKPSSEGAVRAALIGSAGSDVTSLPADVKRALAPFPILDPVVTLDVEGELPAEVRAAFSPTKRRIVFLGLDAMDWILIDRLISEGRMPTFARLKREGAWSHLQSVKPMLSPLLWTSIATSRPPEEHGILEFVVQDPATGAQVPITSRFRKTQAFWNILTAFRLKVNLVGWWATYPAEKINGTLVSERLFFHLFGIESRRDVPGNTYPPEAEKRFAPLMEDAASIGYEEVSRYLHLSRGEFDRRWEAGKKLENPLDDPVNHLRKILAASHSVEAIGTQLLRNGADVTAIYFEGPDTVGHRFGHLMAPRLPWVSEEEFALGRDALPRYYEEVDRITSRLLAAAPSDALWIIASDHGFFTGEARLPSRPDDFKTGATEWHRQSGVLILHGPGVNPGEITSTSIYDLIPTMFLALGAPASREWKGRALTEAFAAPGPVRTVPSYEFLPAPWKTAAPAVPDEERIKELQALGYIAGSPTPQTALPPDSPEPEEGFTLIYNKANSLYTQGNFEGALSLYQRSLELNPDFGPGMFAVGLCHMARLDHGEAYRWFKRSLEYPSKLPSRVLILLADEACTTGRAEDALSLLRTLRRTWEKESAYAVALGILHAHLGNETEAVVRFEEALRIDAAEPRAAEEMLERYLRAGQSDKAALLLKNAWDASSGALQTMNALGLVCLRNGQGRIAEEIFKQVLVSDPDNAGVRGNLASSLQMQGRLAEAAQAFVGAMKLQPENAKFHYLYGACLGQMGRLQEALDAFLKARDLKMEESRLYTALGVTYARLNRKAEAREALEHALTLDPDQSDARRMLEALK